MSAQSEDVHLNQAEKDRASSIMAGGGVSQGVIDSCFYPLGGDWYFVPQALLGNGASADQVKALCALLQAAVGT